MSLSATEVVNVQIIDQPMGAARRDLSMVAIFTDLMGEAFKDATTRYIICSSAQDVANQFGTNTEVYRAAQALFSSKPTPRRVMIARWARSEQKIAASPNALRGSTLSAYIDDLQEIKAGSFALNVGGTEVEFTGIDLSTAVDMNDVAAKLTEKLTPSKLKAIYDAVGLRFIIEAVEAGSKPETKLGYAVEASTGDYLGNILRLENGQASLVVGLNAVTIKKQTVTKALTELNNSYQNWYGVYFGLTLTDAELDEAHTWVASSSIPRVMAYTAIRQDQIEWKSENILKKLFDKNSGRLMVQYNATGDDHAAANLLAKALSTNWSGQNTAQTLKFKQQTSTRSDDRITLNEASKCRRLGINFYTDYDGVPMLAEGSMLGGRWIDEIVGLDAYADACQKQVFNAFHGNPSKIPQTDDGQAMLIGQLKIIGEEFVRNGFFAAGMIWQGNDVGDLKYGDRLDDGYYYYSDSYDTQSTSDRDERKAMPIMNAVKLANAAHSADILVQYNR